MHFFLKRILSQFSNKSREESIREDKEVREHMSERELDKVVEDTFPASDPPARY